MNGASWLAGVCPPKEQIAMTRDLGRVARSGRHILTAKTGKQGSVDTG